MYDNLDYNYYLTDKDELKKDIALHNDEEICGIKCGLDCFDKICRLEKQQLAIITAEKSVGKTTFLNYYSYLMFKNNRMKSCFLFYESGNIRRQTKYLAKSYYNGNTDFVVDNYEFCDTNKVNTVEDLYKIIQTFKEKRQIDIAVIDNFIYLPLHDWDTISIGHFLSQLKQLAQDLDIIIILVAHPTKLNGNKISGERISGSANFQNMADTLLLFERDITSNVMTITVDKLRYNFDMGKMGASCKLALDWNTKVYSEYKPNGKYDMNDTNEVIDNFDNVNVAAKVYNKIKNSNVKPIPANEDEDKKTYQIEDNQTIKAEIKNDLKQSVQVDNRKLEDYTVSYYPNCNSKIPTQKTLEECLHTSDCYNYIDQIRNEEKKLTNLLTKDEIDTIEKKIKELKCKLSCFSISASFTASHSKDNLNHYNALLCVDIDAKDNQYKDVNELRETVLKSNLKPYIFYLAKSCSGKGLFAIIQITSNIDNFEHHFNALYEDFTTIGINIDKNCKDYTRLRFTSHDTDYFYDEQAKVYTKMHNTTPPNYLTFQQNNVDDTLSVNIATTQTIDAKKKRVEDDKAFSKALKDIDDNNLCISLSHEDTLNIRAALINTFGGNGLNAYLTIKSKKSNYNEQEEIKNYMYDLHRTNELPKYHVGTIMNLYKQSNNNNKAK